MIHIFTGVFCGLLVIASVTAVKLVQIAGIVFPAGVFAYAFTFTVTDVVNELFGKKEADRVVTAGWVTLFLSCLFVNLALVLPPASFWKHQEAFFKILGTNWRIVLASFTAYLVSQFHDVWHFDFLKKIFKGKHLWFRNNLSTMLSQLMDTVIFITLAFYSPAMSFLELFRIIFGQYLVKIVLALVDTPLVYFFVYIIRKKFSKNLSPAA